MIKIINCIECGECVASCANRAILFNKEGSAEIDKDKCIDCEECLDFGCPVDGIEKI